MADPQTDRELAVRRETGEAGPSLWDRLEHEPDGAWEAFKTYRDAGLSRSVVKVSEQLDRSRSTLQTYANRYSWVLRAAAFDMEADRLDQLWMQQERRKATVRHVRQAQALGSKWLSALAQIQPTDLSPSDVIRYADVATRLEREALSLSGQPIDVNVTVEAVKSLSPQDTKLRLAALQREIAARAAEVEDEEDDVVEGVFEEAG